MTSRRDLWLVIAMASLASVTISLAFPLLSLVLERHGVDAFGIGLNSAAGAVGSLVAAPLTYQLAQRLGAVRIMQIGLLVVAGCMLLFPLRVDPMLWGVWRFMLGAAGAIVFVLCEAGINALAPSHRRGQVIALYATSFSLGYAAGPLLLALVGSEGALPFVVAAAFLALSALPLGLVRSLDAALTSPAPGTSEAGSATLDREWALLRRGALPFFAVLVYAVLETTFFALLPVYVLAKSLGESHAATFLSVWIAGNIVFQLPIGWLADRTSPAAALILCVGLSLVGLALLDPAVDRGWTAWPVLLAAGGAMGAIYALSLTMIGERFPPAELTRANTAFVIVFQLGLLTGPAAVGAAMTDFGAGTMPWALTLPVGALLLATILARRWQRASRVTA